jgi:hypothetical protein
MKRPLIPRLPHPPAPSSRTAAKGENGSRGSIRIIPKRRSPPRAGAEEGIDASADDEFLGVQPSGWRQVAYAKATTAIASHSHAVVIHTAPPDLNSYPKSE